MIKEMKGKGKSKVEPQQKDRTEQEGIKQGDPLERIAEAMEDQARALEAMLRVRGLGKWFDQYTRLETVVNEDSIATMKAMMDDFVNPAYSADVLRRQGSDGFDQWLKRILVKQRVYEFFLFVHNLEQAIPDPGPFPDASFGIRRWLRELCWTRDFRMVHDRQGSYYPSFSKLVNEILHQEADRCEAMGRKSLAIEMRRSAGTTSADVEYEKYLKKEDGKKCALIEEMATEKGLIPLTRSNFHYLWVRYLDRDEEGEEVERQELLSNLAKDPVN